MQEFVPIFLLLFIWIMVGLPAVIAKKNAEQKKPARPAVPRTPENEVSAPAAQPAEPVRLTTLTPAVSPAGHDDSVYQGSLNAVTGEGYDPCHEEQLAALTLAEETPLEAHPQQVHSGIPLGWTNNDVVRGIVMSEILNRKH